MATKKLLVNLDVTGTGVFSGTVSGANATLSTHLVALGQLNISNWNDAYTHISDTNNPHNVSYSQLSGTPDLSVYLKNIVEDTTPELGGDLDAKNKNIDNVNVIRAVALDANSTVQLRGGGQLFATLGNGKFILNHDLEPDTDNTKKLGLYNKRFSEINALILRDGAGTRLNLANSEARLEGQNSVILGIGQGGEHLKVTSTVITTSIPFEPANGVTGTFATTDKDVTVSKGIITAIATGGSGGGIGGSIADDQVAFGNGTDITGSNDFKWNGTTLALSKGGTVGISTVDTAHYTGSHISEDGFNVANDVGTGTRSYLKRDRLEFYSSGGNYHLDIGISGVGITANRNVTFQDKDGVVALTSDLNSLQSPLTFTGPLQEANDVVTIDKADGSTDGYLSSTDWNTFNNKTSNIGDITRVNITAGTGLSGDKDTTSGEHTQTINLSNTAVTPGSYSNVDITVDAQGRITAASNGTTGDITKVTAGNGLTGGGDTGDVTLNVGNGNGIAAAANSIGLTTLSANWNAGSTYTITANDFILSSDKRLKTNIKPINTEPLDVDYKEFVFLQNKSRKRFGVIAQEVEEKYPFLVSTDEEGMKAVSYIDLLVREVAALKDKNKNLEERLKRLEEIIHTKL